MLTGLTGLTGFGGIETRLPPLFIMERHSWRQDLRELFPRTPGSIVCKSRKSR